MPVLTKIKQNKFKIILGLIAIFAIYFLFFKTKTPTLLVKEVKVQNKQVVRSISSSGSVKSNNEADLSFASTGRIVDIAVAKGDVVKKGTFLAKIDTSSISQSVQALKDGRDSLIRERDLFIYQKAKNEKLLGGETEYNLKLRQLNEQVDQADNSYKSQTSLITNSYLYAPFDGTVLDVTKVKGETATATEVIVKMANLSNLVFNIQVDQEDYGMIKQDMNVDIKLDSYSGYTFKGKVVDLPLFADSVTDNFSIDVKIENFDDHPIRLGMQGDAYIILASTTGEVPTLVVDEVNYDLDNKPFVWIVQDTKLRKLPINIGLEGDIYIELKSDIKDTIVVPAKEDIKLQEGFKAQVIK